MTWANRRDRFGIRYGALYWMGCWHCYCACFRHLGCIKEIEVPNIGIFKPNRIGERILLAAQRIIDDFVRAAVARGNSNIPFGLLVGLRFLGSGW